MYHNILWHSNQTVVILKFKLQNICVYAVQVNYVWLLTDLMLMNWWIHWKVNT